MSAAQTSARSRRLQQLDRLLERDPDAIDARFERASLHREDGLFEAAKRDFLEILRRRPTDFAALNDFGTLVLKAGYREAARSLFGEAVRHHPNNPNGRVNLANLLLLLGERAQARSHFEAALGVDPDHIHAHRGMGNLLAEIGDRAGARQHRDKGFKGHALTRLPYRGDGAPIAVLLLVSAAGGNIPTEALLDARYFQTTVLVTEYAEASAALPPHDVVFNSIGDADLCEEALQAAERVLARTTRPVINHPAQVRKTGRFANVERLRGLSNVVVPHMARLPKTLLTGPHAAAAIAARGFVFPFLVRAPGFHTGFHFVRVETAAELTAAIAEFPGEDVWAIEQLDASDAAGTFRKFRVMIVDRQLYPLHLAVSQNWKVHYFTADMAQAGAHRQKEAAFLDDMTSVVGPRGIAALERIKATLNLDYGGIDFAVGASGDILFFEANATMAVLPLAGDDKWAYRRAAFERVFAAVRKMLTDRAIAESAA